MVEIYRGVAATACRIDVDHFDIFADWPRFEMLTISQRTSAIAVFISAVSRVAARDGS